MVECVVGIAAKYLQLQLFWDGVSCATQPVNFYPVARWGGDSLPRYPLPKTVGVLKLDAH